MESNVLKKEKTKEVSSDGLQYDIKSTQCPSQEKKLVALEEDLVKLVKIIKFRKVRNELQTQLATDLTETKSSSKTVTPADKTSNMYRLTMQEYKHHRNPINIQENKR